jgi:hypothetical protein
MSLRHRLKRLERALPSEAVLSLVCVDEQGLILDGGSDQMHPWIGHHNSDVPGAPKVIVGVDPLVVLGRHDAGEQ